MSLHLRETDEREHKRLYDEHIDGRCNCEFPRWCLFEASYKAGLDRAVALSEAQLELSDALWHLDCAVEDVLLADVAGTLRVETEPLTRLDEIRGAIWATSNAASEALKARLRARVWDELSATDKDRAIGDI